MEVHSEASAGLTLPEDLLLLLLDERTGRFPSVPGWSLTCALVGAGLAELSLLSRIDTDDEALRLLDAADTGDPILDQLLKEVAEGPDELSAQHWIERLAGQAEWIADAALERLADRRLLERHDSGYWAPAPARRREGRAVRARIEAALFTDDIPEPRDVIAVSLAHACDALRLAFAIDARTEERIEIISRMDLIGRSLAAAVARNVANRRLRPSPLAEPTPAIPFRSVLFSRPMRAGNLPLAIAALAVRHGPVFRIRLPFGEDMTVLAGPEVNAWAHREGGMHLTSGGSLVGYEDAFGAFGALPSLDGTDHFRLRKALGEAHGQGRLKARLDESMARARAHMAAWVRGSSVPARDLRRLANAQVSPLLLSIDSQDLIDGVAAYTERAALVRLLRLLPAWTLRTPAMRRAERDVDALVDRVRKAHTQAQRAGCPRALADDWLALSASDSMLVPEANLRFALASAPASGILLGDAMAFALHALSVRPDLRRMIEAEADALFEDGDPAGEALTAGAIDVTRRFLSECLRLHPVMPLAVRTVANPFTLAGREVPAGAKVHLVHAAAHHMEEAFPDPGRFDIDRHLPGSGQGGASLAPYGLGAHRCLGAPWADLQMAVNVLLIARHLRLEAVPGRFADALPLSPLPWMKPTAKLRFRVASRRHPLPSGAA